MGTVGESFGVQYPFIRCSAICGVVGVGIYGEFYLRDRASVSGYSSCPGDGVFQDVPGFDVLGDALWELSLLAASMAETR